MTTASKRLSLVLHRRVSFFATSEGERDIAICNNFCSMVLGIDPLNNLQQIRASISLKNPKRKGWAKIEYSDYLREVTFNGNRFHVCSEERYFLNSIGVVNSFWIKIEDLTDKN